MITNLGVKKRARGGFSALSGAMSKNKTSQFMNTSKDELDRQYLTLPTKTEDEFSVEKTSEYQFNYKYEKILAQKM